MTTQEKRNCLILLKDELTKKWKRRRTMNVLEFRLFLSEAVEAVTSQLLLEEEKERKADYVSFDHKLVLSKVDGKPLSRPTIQPGFPEMNRHLYPED